MGLKDFDSDSSDEGGSDSRAVYGVARKSTVTSPAITRRQMALARERNAKVLMDAEKFMENFDPDTSVRERRKLTRKINSNVRRPQGALYDEVGVHLNTGVDLCDCLNSNCSGCHFPCPKCKSTKCGPECRVNRKFVYEQLEYQGCDLTVKNPLLSK